jgi:hypothetical protein
VEASSISRVDKYKETVVIYNNDIVEALNMLAAIVVPSMIRPNIGWTVYAAKRAVEMSNAPREAR